MSRISNLIQTIPPASLAVIGLCCALYILQIVADFPLHAVTLCPRLVVYAGEYYRVITSAHFHASLIHVGMNLTSTSAIGAMLEKRLGTLRMIFTIVWSILLTSIIYICMALFLDVAIGRDGLMYQHSIGFSGVIFHLSVLECNLGPHGSRSVFGLFQVPSFVYPWVL
jgi:membrane associated rhomboid family serine protease